MTGETPEAFCGAVWDGADFAGRDFRDADLRGASLVGANLRGSNLARAVLRGANVAGADLTGAELTGAELTDADLTGVRGDAGTRWPDGFDLKAHQVSYAAASAPLPVRSFDERVEATFFEDGRLKQIPARSQKKLRVVLRRLAEAFEPERRYPESEVNAVLLGFHPDCATLRRMLCDHRWMARQHGLYWRLRNVEGLKEAMRRSVASETRT